MKSIKGFTLIELTIYISLAIVLLLGTTDFIISINSLRQRGFIMAEVENQGLRVMDIVARYIRNSNGINSPSWSGDTVSLVSSDVTKNPTIIRLNGKTLEIIEGEGAPYILHSDKVVLENVYFTNLTRSGTKGLVRIEFDVRYNTNSENPRLKYKRTFYGSASIR